MSRCAQNLGIGKLFGSPLLLEGTTDHGWWRRERGCQWQVHCCLYVASLTVDKSEHIADALKQHWA